MKIYLLISIILYTFAKGIDGGHVPLTRELPTSPFPFLQVGIIEKLDNMAKKKTLEQVKCAFFERWGDRFGYELITKETYVNMNTKVPVVCKEHGVFEISPHHHINGVGCRGCQYKQLRETPLYKNRKLVLGVGVYDVPYSCNASEQIHVASQTWRRMLDRCYGETHKKRRKTYIGCSVCDEWKHFSNFKKWFDENYTEGYALDKDIIIKGNKVYSPETCCFVPNEINSLIVNRKNGRGKLPLGVRFGCGKGKYTSIVSINNITKYIGTFDTIIEAFEAYKQAKEAHIKEVAQEYYSQGKITEKVYNALMNYKVEITD